MYARNRNLQRWPALILALALMVPRALAAAERLKSEAGIDCEVIDVRSLVPLDTQTILASVAKTHRVLIVEEQKPFASVGSQLAFMIQEEAFDDLDAVVGCDQIGNAEELVGEFSGFWIAQ